MLRARGDDSSSLPHSLSLSLYIYIYYLVGLRLNASLTPKWDWLSCKIPDEMLLALLVLYA